MHTVHMPAHRVSPSVNVRCIARCNTAFVKKLTEFKDKFSISYVLLWPEHFLYSVIWDQDSVRKLLAFLISTLSASGGSGHLVKLLRNWN